MISEFWNALNVMKTIFGSQWKWFQMDVIMEKLWFVNRIRFKCTKYPIHNIFERKRLEKMPTFLAQLIWMYTKIGLFDRVNHYFLDWFLINAQTAKKKNVEMYNSQSSFRMCCNRNSNTFSRIIGQYVELSFFTS